MMWHDVEQNTPDWDALRLGKVTASKSACFMAHEGKAFGDPAKEYALQVALERITGTKAEYSFSNKHMERGHEQEPLARLLYEEERFADVSNGGFFDWGDYGDSPDGLVYGDGVLEIKSVVAATHYANIRRGSCDPAYKWQLVSHLDCTERDWAEFASFCADFPEGKRLFVYRMHRKDSADEIQRLRKRRAEFLSLVNEITDHIQQKAA